MAAVATHPTIAGRPSLSSLIFDKGIMKRAAIIAAIVGTILNGIAQLDLVMGGQPPVWWKIILTYCVPYCVATYGAVTARLDALKRQDWA